MSSLEHVEKIKYIKPGKSVLDIEGNEISLVKGDISGEPNNYSISLDGMWKLNGYDAKVPGSIHTALFEAGVIKDPYKYRNDDEARELSFREWDYTKEFTYEGSGENVWLVFGGICDRCDIFLNDIHLGFHQGMFAPVEFNVSEHIIKGTNTVRVHLYPAIDFNQTVVFNCSYGWHYARIWPLGIWENVKIEDRSEVYFDHPFITTKSHDKGTMELLINLIGDKPNGTVHGKISPFNFAGDPYTFKTDISENSTKVIFDIPEFKLWWPNGFGEQSLYELELIYSEQNVVKDKISTTFGIRTLTMKPFPSGEKEDTYNRTCVINGRGIFMKGAGWCTIDALMRFDTEDYDRILSRAKQQGVNFLRSWGGGLVETDEFYSLCDKYGICVYQEWPCCWDSQKVQPAQLLYETVITQTKRIRNRPSLVLYGGGNEGYGGFEDEVLNRIGALTYEYDGTRVFYRQDGGVSSKGMTHDHIHWGGETPEHYITRYGKSNEVNMHEYGLDAMMNIESVLKFADMKDVIEWPINDRGVIAHHTATFNGEYGWNPTPHGFDIDTFIHYSKMFLEPGELKDVILGSQLAQAMAKYPTLIDSRIKWPHCTKAVYYKFNDVYPGAAWSVVDWYGSPKIAHYLCQDAYMPLIACGLFDRYNTYDKEDKSLTVPVYVLDDNNRLLSKTYSAEVKAYNSDLDCIKSEKFTGSAAGYLGDFYLDENEASSYPLIITFTLTVDNDVFRTYMYLNFDKIPGSLFSLPVTDLEWKEVSGEDNSILSSFERFNEYGANDKWIKISNTGEKAAVSVHIVSDGSDTFVCSDNHFFLESGESKVIKVNDIGLIKGVTCFNSRKEAIKKKDISLNLKAEAAGHDTVKVTWDKLSVGDGYVLFMDNMKVAGIPEKNEYTVTGLKENTEYAFSIGVYEDFEFGMCNDRTYVKTLHDRTAPQVQWAYFCRPDAIEIAFSKDISADINSFDIPDVNVKDVSVSGNKAVVVMGKEIPVTEGVNVYLKNIYDNTYCKNELSDKETYAKPLVINCGGYKYGEGTTVIKDCSFSIKTAAKISMRIKPDSPGETYQVFFARGSKGGSAHFEFYINPEGDLKMYSSKGDHYLGVNLLEYAGKWCDFEVTIADKTVKIYFNGKCTYTGKDRVDADDGSYAIALGSLLDNTLVFNGELENVCLYRGIDV